MINVFIKLDKINELHDALTFSLKLKRSMLPQEFVYNINVIFTGNTSTGYLCLVKTNVDASLRIRVLLVLSLVIGTVVLWLLQWFEQSGFGTLSLSASLHPGV